MGKYRERGSDADFTAQQTGGARLTVRPVQRFIILAKNCQRLLVMGDLLIEQQAVMLILFTQALA